MDENKVASLVESLCERPFADGPQAQSAPMRALVPPAAPAQPPHPNPTLLAGMGTEGGEAAPSMAASTTPSAAASMASGELAAILSGSATPTQVEAFHQAAAESEALRLEAQSALAFVDGIEQAPLAAPAFLVQQVLPAGRTIPGAPKPSIWSQLLPRRQVAAACVMLLMGGGLTWSLIGRNVEAPREASPPLPAASPAGDTDLDAIVRSKAPASERAPLAAPAADAVAAPRALGAVPAPAAGSTPMPEAALPPAKVDPCAPGVANSTAAREITSPAASQLAQSPKPPAGPPMRAAAVAAGDPGCPAEEGRTMQSTAVAPDNPQTTEEPRNQRSDKARANRAASRKAAADRVRSSAAAPAAVPPAHAARPTSPPSLPERAR